MDTDTTATLEGEAWLLNNGYTQAEGVANLDLVAPTGCLINIGYPKFAGGVGGYARFIAICGSGWGKGVSIDPAKESPMPKSVAPLVWNKDLGYRVREGVEKLFDESELACETAAANKLPSSNNGVKAASSAPGLLCLVGVVMFCAL